MPRWARACTALGPGGCVLGRPGPLFRRVKPVYPEPGRPGPIATCTPTTNKKGIKLIVQNAPAAGPHVSRRLVGSLFLSLRAPESELRPPESGSVEALPGALEQRGMSLIRIAVSVFILLAVVESAAATRSPSADVQNAIYSNRITIFSKSYCP